MSTLKRIQLVVGLLWLWSSAPALAENRTRVPINMTIDGGRLSPIIDTVIHGDGFIDFSEVTFDSLIDDEDYQNNKREKEKLANETNSSSHLRHVHVVDIAVFASDPPEEDNDPNRDSKIYSKRLTDIGIGAMGTDNQYHFCCTREAKEAKACRTIDFGRLILEPALFQGASFPVQFLDDDKHSISSMRGASYDAGAVFFEGTGHVSTLFANCSPQSPPVHIYGELVEASFASASSLPFYIVMTVLHILLLVWYRYLMQVNADERIRLEEWIFCTICLAAVDIVLHTIFESAIAKSDHDIKWLDALGVLAHAAKHGLSRVLYVMVSLGWGVVRETLADKTMCFLYLIGIAYMIVTSLNDIFLIFEWYTESEDDTIFMMYCLVGVINIVFLIWIPIALCQTTSVLRLYGQQRKLERYMWLSRIFGLTFTITVFMMYSYLFFLFSPETSRFDEQSLERGNEIIYFFILSCIAYLWRPNPQARLYSSYQVMEDVDLDNDGNDTDLAMTVGDDDETEVTFDQFEIGDDDDEDNENGGFEMTSTSTTSNGFSDSVPGHDIKIV